MVLLPAERVYKDYLGAVKYGNIFSLDASPDYSGKLREIDVQTLRRVDEMIRNPPLDLSMIPPKASRKWGPGYEADKAVDLDEGTRWGVAPGTNRGWIEVDLGAPKPINHAVIEELQYPRTKQFAIEYKVGDTCKPVVSGTTIAGNKSFDFPEITAQHM